VTTRAHKTPGFRVRLWRFQNKNIGIGRRKNIMLMRRGVSIIKNNFIGNLKNVLIL